MSGKPEDECLSIQFSFGLNSKNWINYDKVNGMKCPCENNDHRSHKQHIHRDKQQTKKNRSSGKTKRTQEYHHIKVSTFKEWTHMHYNLNPSHIFQTPNIATIDGTDTLSLLALK